MTAPTGPPLVHQALLYSDEAEAADDVVAVLRAATRRGEPALAVLPPAVRDGVEGRLGGSGGGVLFQTLDRFHLPSLETTIRQFVQTVDRLSAAGRVTTVIAGHLRNVRDADSFCERAEHATHIVAAGRPVTATCLYDTRQASPAQLEIARRAHPALVVGGVARPNPDHLPLPVADGAMTVTTRCGRDGLAALRDWVRTLSLGWPADVLDHLVLLVAEAVTAAITAQDGPVEVGSRHGRDLASWWVAGPADGSVPPDIALVADLHPHVTVEVQATPTGSRLAVTARR